MIREVPKWTLSAVLAVAAAAAPIACGGGGTAADLGGGGNDGSGGNASDGQGAGGRSSGGRNGSGGNGQAGSNGSGGAPTTASINELIAAICAWEFSCCNEGELGYRLGPAGTSVEECVDWFTFQLHRSNTTSNPFPGGTATGLLGTLGYTVDLTRVVENPTGIAACIAEYQELGCPSEAVTLGYCTEPVQPGASACSLTNLFQPGLAEGDRCTLALSEGNGNDVECPAGSTCLAAGDPDNPEDFPVCVQRGQDGDPCTANADCDYDFYCNPSGDCTEKGGAGDDCTFNDEDNPQPGDEDASCKAGLKCDPVELVCVLNCSESYPCTTNVECPEDFVCAPVTVGNDSTSWKQCVAVGTSASDRCDEDADCAPNRYCDGSVCQGDADIGDSCSKDSMCETGSFCDQSTYDALGASGRTPALSCTAYFQAGEPCFFPGDTPTLGISSGCSPSAPLCLYDPVDGRWECADELRGEGDGCYDMVNLAARPSECEPGFHCEVVDEAVTWPYVCTTGAELGDDCDTNYGGDIALGCGPGLTCKDGECVSQRDPGEDCEDAANPGSADPTLCKNSDCVPGWNENGPDFVCSDAPIPVANGGDNLTCGED